MPRSLNLTIELKTTDTGSEFRTNALVDSGTTGSFIDSDFVHRNGIATWKLLRPVPVLNIDGTPNEGGQIVEVVDLILRYKRHGERILLAVTNLGKKNLILGYTWLHEHNPEIDWETREVKLSQCPRCCSECRDEIRAEKAVLKPPSLTYRSLSGHRVCYATLLSALRGSSHEFPETPDIPGEGGEDGEDEDANDEEEWPDEPKLEEGDRVFATAYCTPPRGSQRDQHHFAADCQKIHSEYGRKTSDAAGTDSEGTMGL